MPVILNGQLATATCYRLQNRTALKPERKNAFSAICDGLNGHGIEISINNQ